MPETVHLGQTLQFIGDPFAEGPGAARHERQGAVLINAGQIRAVGPAEAFRAAYPEAQIVDHGEGLILPGFIDAHAHMPQTGIIASWGKRLIEWLNSYTFPEELRFADPAYAAAGAELYLDLSLRHGITTGCTFCSVHAESAEALFTAAQARGLRWLGGKVMMDRNAPRGLSDGPEQGAEASAALIDRWHGVGRLGYAISPRFAPTSTEAQLRAAGALWAQYPDCAMQTHLSEQTEEIAWVAELFPEARDYLDVYERAGLAGAGALMGHAIHLRPREWAAMAATGAAIVHCPTSNTFIGSGLCDVAGARALGIPVALGTDVGGGSSFSMLRTMAAAYEISQLRGRPLHPGELLWLASEGGAEALRLSGTIGRLAAGAEADLVVLDLASTPEIAQRASRAEDIWEALFPTIMMGDDRAIAAVYVAGQRVEGTAPRSFEEAPLP